MTNFNDIMIDEKNNILYRPEMDRIIQIWYETADISMFTWYCQRQGYVNVAYGCDDKGKKE